MSDDKQPAIIEGAAEEHVVRREMLATLVSEATRIGNLLTKVGHLLHNAHGISSPGETKDMASAVYEHMAQFPAADSLLLLVNEICAEIQRKRSLDDSLGNMGVEPDNRTGDWEV